VGSFWKLDGKVIVDGAKHPIFCETCPCDVTPDCYADVIAALRERQRVLDYVFSIDVWPEVPDPKKTLAKCIAETNKLAPYFVSGTYSGGSGEPTMRSGSYANGAADFCELYVLIKALVETRVDPGEGYMSSASATTYKGWSRSTSSFTAAKAGAEADWGEDPGGAMALVYRKLTYNSPYRIAEEGVHPIAWTITPTYASIARSARVFAKFRAFTGYERTGSSIWDDQGYSVSQDTWLTKSQWACSAGSWSSWTSDAWPASISEPNTWPDDPTVNGKENIRGASYYDAFCLMDWSFKHR